MIFSDVKAPLLSPSRIIQRAGRSLTEPPGLYHSALPRMRTPDTSPEMLGSSRSGVLPTSSVTRPPAHSLIRVIMSGLIIQGQFFASRKGRILANAMAGRPRKGASRPWLVRYRGLYPSCRFRRYGEIANYPRDFKIFGNGLRRQVK